MLCSLEGAGITSSTGFIPPQAALATEIFLLDSETLTHPQSDPGAAPGWEKAGECGTAQPASTHENSLGK